MDDRKNRPKLSEATVRQWFEKAVMPKGSKDPEDMAACLRDLGVDAELYKDMDVVCERFNVRALPYAFTGKSPLIPVFVEIALQHDVDVDGTPVPVLASDSALSGAESVFVLYVQYISTADTDFAPLRLKGRAARDASMFRTATLQLEGGFEMRVTGLHAVTYRQDDVQ